MNKKLFITVLIISLMPTTALAAPPKPTQAQIDAAKKIEAEKKAAADAAAKKLNSAKKTLKQLTSIALAKRKIYVAAQNDLKRKTNQAEIAMKHLANREKLLREEVISRSSYDAAVALMENKN